MADEGFADENWADGMMGAGVGGKRYPHGLAEPFLFGFNAKTWSFGRHGTIFDATFDEGNKFYFRNDLGETEFDVPDGAFVTECGKQITGEVHLSSNLSQSHDSAFATTVETSISGVSGSASASFALEKSSQVATEDKKASVSIGALKSIYSFIRLENGQASAHFAEAIAKLPDRFDADDPENKKKFTLFFETWGTHYLQYGLFGGTYTLVMTADEQMLKQSNAMKTDASLSAGFDAGFASGSAKTTVEQQTADALGMDRRSLKENWVTTGGDRGRQIEEWFDSVNRLEKLLCDVTTMRAAAAGDGSIAPQFMPIFDLAEDGSRAKIEQALKVYLGSAHSLLPVGDQTRPTWSDVNLADRTGFLFASAVPAADIADDYAGYGIAIDDTLDPKTIYAGETMACPGWNSSLFIPISQGKHFYGIRTDSGKGGLDARFQPYPVSFGEWFDLPLDGELQAEKPGFLCGHVSMPQQGNRGELRAAVDEAGIGASAHAYSGSSARVAQASFCVPVQRQAKVRTSAKDTAGKCGYALRFLPLEGGLEFDGGWQPMTLGRSYTAATDGFVIAQLELGPADFDYFFAWLVGTIRVTDAQRPEASFQAPFTATWMSYNEAFQEVTYRLRGDWQVPIATATAFVRSGSSWDVSVGLKRVMNEALEPYNARARCWWQPVRRV